MKSDVYIALPLEHQVEPLDDPSRFKLWRWGRRAGKTRGAFRAASIGHGGGKGFLQGGEIIWVARDYPNADTVWRREILERFAGKPGIKIDKKDKRVSIDGTPGALTVQSADNIDSVRGGDWDGAVIDEAAHLDLRNVLYEVVRPGLVDRKGWLLAMSTTKAGSEFNALCERVMADELDGWRHWHRTAFDNPKLDPVEIEAMVAEYDDEVVLKQEVYAELVVPGGYALPEWNSAVHVMRLNPPRDWNWVACMDWGYVRPGWFGLAALGPDTEVYFRKELRFQETEPYEVGCKVGWLLHHSGVPLPAYVVSDPQMWARDDSEITVADEVQSGLRKVLGDDAPALIEAPKGPGSRFRSKVLVHKGLKWEPHPERPDEPRSKWKAPRLRFHADCAYAISTLPKLPRDPNDPEVVDKRADDHAYDAVRYLLMMHNPFPEREDDGPPPHRHPGLTRKGRRKQRSRWEPDEDDYSGARYQAYAGLDR